MKNPNPTKIDNTVIAWLYTEVLLRWEKELNEKGFYIRSKGFSKYRKEKTIKLAISDNLEDLPDTFNEWHPILRLQPQNIFVYYNDGKGKAKSLYFHLRNAIGHGHIERIKIGRSDYYYFESFKTSASLHKERMKGQIKASMLKDFITALQLTVKEEPDISG